MYYNIVAKCFIENQFKDRESGKTVNFSGWRIVCEEWQEGAKNPGSVKIFKLHNSLDAGVLECGVPCILQTQPPYNGNGLSTITGVFYK